MGSFKLIKPFIEKNKLYLILYTICVCLTYPLESVIVPKLFSSFFENIKDISGISGNNENSVFINFFKNLFILLLVIGVSQTIVSKLDIYLIPRLNETISNVFFEKILQYYENNYTDLELGKILVRINGLPSILRELTTDLFNWMLPKILTVLIINIYIFSINKVLGLISLSIILLLIFINYYSFKKCIKISNKRYETYEDKSEILQDKLSNLFSIYSSGNMKEEINNFKTITGNFKSIQEESLHCTHNIKSINGFLSTLLFISMAVYTTYLYKTNTISKVTLTTLFMLIIFYNPCINTIITYLPDYINHLGIIESVNDYIDDIYIENNIKPDIIINQGNIDIVNLTFGYTKNNNIFNNFNLNININEKIAIIGPSGNGKSTLIKLIMGYYPVPKNTIFIDNQDINDYNLSSLRKQITYINQNTKLFNKSIFENIKYGNDITNDDIMNAYYKFNLDRIYKNLPDNFNTNVGVNGDSISGGQKQIILLLRNYFKNNKIVILDEPTSALDDITRLTVIDIIKDISENSTLIIITHDLNNLNIVNKKITLKNGTIVNNSTNAL